MSDPDWQPISPAPAADAPAAKLQMQSEIARISHRLLSIELDAIEAAIQEEIANAASLAGCERTRFLFLDPAREERYWTAEWETADAEPHEAPMDTERFGWAWGCLREGRVIHIPNVETLPADALAERNDLTRRGVKALLAVPVHSQRTLIGVQVFDRRIRAEGWSESEITGLRLVAEIFASALKRHSAERALRGSEQRFRTIAEEATELVAEFDARGNYCYVSPSYRALLGYEPQELIGTTAERLIHPDDSERSRTKFARAFANDVESHSIHRLRRADGEWRWFENSGRAFRREDGHRRFVSIGHDVTDRVRAQQALERQLELERTVARLSRRLLGVTDEELAEEIRSSLEESARMMGADRAYLVTFPRGADYRGNYYQWTSGRVAPLSGGARRPWSEAMLARGETIHFPDVHELPAEARPELESTLRRGVQSILAIPVRQADVSVGVIGFENQATREWSLHELTLIGLIGEILTSAVQRSVSQRALREKQLELAQSQKLEAVGRLAGGIAHDFNNLLTVILGLSRPMLDELEVGSEQRADLTDIHRAAERAAALTRQLLTFSRRQPVEDQHVDLNETLAQLTPLLERMLDEDVTLSCSLGDERAWVRGDPHQFEQIVVNLAANARDAMPRGGRVELTTKIENVDLQRAGRLRLSRAQRYVLVSIKDNGEGMDERTRRRIFDPFYTTKDPGKGTGLGLSIVYSIVEQAEGAIDVESTPGEGTRFDIWLPYAPGDDAPLPAKPAGLPAAGGNESVLLVEDEPAVRRLGRRILVQAGYAVIEARDGEHALSILEAEEGPIDALVTDVIMPRIGGAELARRAREKRPGLPILFVSGHPDDRGQPLDFEGAELLHKPFSADVLLDRLRELIDAADD